MVYMKCIFGRSLHSLILMNINYLLWFLAARIARKSMIPIIFDADLWLKNLISSLNTRFYTISLAIKIWIIHYFQFLFLVEKAGEISSISALKLFERMFLAIGIEAENYLKGSFHCTNPASQKCWGF